MTTTHLYDLAVKTGEYQNRDGQTKARYENIGKVLRNDNGQFMLLKRTFSPAGVPGDGDMVAVSMFEPRPRDGAPSERQEPQQGRGPAMDDEIPFAVEWRA